MNKHILLVIFLVILSMIEVKSQDTFSIVAVDSITGEVGGAAASCVDLDLFLGFTDDFLVELFPSVGAIVTQASYTSGNQINARNRMNLGETPRQIIQWLANNDVTSQPQIRQYGIVAFVGGMVESAAYTGTSTLDYKNHIEGPNYSIQGNILLGQEVLDSMEARFLNADGDLACKLMAAMQGANMVGADTRCASNNSSSLFAFVKVAQPTDTFGNPSFVLSVRTSDGDQIEPIDSLQTLFDNSRICTASSVNHSEVFKSYFSVYPNPVEDIISIDSKGFETYQLEIVNIVGATLYQTTFQHQANIDVSSFPKGIYFIQISDGDQSYITKMIKR